MDHPFQSPAIISFCPGILGIERGLERAIGKLRILAYCEIEAFICANLVAGMESGVLAPAPIWTDAKTFPAQIFRGKVHGITGGYPCPPFSYAGNRKGEEDPRHIWPYLRRHIDTIRPVWCFFENVAGHLTLGYDTVQKELNDLGYSVEPGIFSAEEVGAPHQRKRLFILAISNTASEQDWRLFQSWVWAYIGRSGELAHCNSIDRRLPESERRKQVTKVTRSSEDVADSDDNGHGAGARRATEESGETQSETQREEWDILLREWLRHESGNCCSTMVNTIIPERKQADQTNTQPDAGEARTKLSIGCFEMVHTGVHHLERVLPQKFDAQGWEGQEERPAGSSDVWPARPGEDQFEWEPPRTIGQKYRLPNSLRTMWRESRKDFAKMLGEEVFAETDRNIRAHFEPRLDSIIDGYNFREDLLRALGNSVVEQTAELAFITLLQKHLKNLS